MAGRLSFHCCRNISSLNWVKAALLFFIYHLAGAVSDRVIVDPHITAVLGKNITLICKVFVVEALTQISWEKVQNGSTQTLAVYNPSYGISIDEPYQQRMSFKSPSNRDATIILEDVRFTDTGEYICKVTTFPSGNSQSSTTVSVMVEPKVYVVKGSQPLIDGGNETIVAVCKAEKGKPAAEVTWESDVFGQSFQNLSTEPNETITVSNYYKWIPTRFAQGKQLTCVVRHPALEMEVRIPFVLNIKHAPEVGITGYDENWFVGRENVQLKCNVAANPPPTKYAWSRSDGEWPSDLQSVNNTLIFSKPLHHNHSGTYQCEVTNEIGSSKKQRTIHILDPPPTTTLSTTSRPFVASDITSLAATNRSQFTSPTLESLHSGNLGSIIGGAVGGALFLILLIIVLGMCYMRKRRTFRGDYYTKQYLGPSDMQKESQLDVLQPHELELYSDPSKGTIKQKPNDMIYPDYPKEMKNHDWGTIDNMNNGCPEDSMPVEYYEDRRLPIGTKYVQDDYYEGNDGDFVSHLDGSVISRREWYV
ncbi:nectin-3-like isoform X1 [Erpetoichthys calabaricus]|uniref:nectin-3-like isoform X1 n=1 Tax=Erpetoichthys calabaricus TaxID=27687 RepID=UPI002233EDEF|nr:nectin-3-like isoform X1 [Erpetoichthys calabaricus]